MIPLERQYIIEPQHVSLLDTELKGKILDIGGGGEGVIGQMHPDRVIAIDPSLDELLEAPGDPIKAVMDARNLCFLDNTFDTVTSFFTLFFIENGDHETVFREAFRVLKPGGGFHVWEVDTPKYDGGERNILVVHLSVDIPQRCIKTGYGSKLPSVARGETYYGGLGARTGFHEVKRTRHDKVLAFEFMKR